jgi:hypothetical protein
MADGNRHSWCLPTVESEVAASGLLLKLEEYWRSVLRNRRMPARRDIDPAGMRRLLPTVFLLDVIDRPARFRWRLVGTKIGDLEQAEYTGKWLDETLRYPDDPFVGFCQATVAERRPTCHAALRRDPDGSTRPLQRALLPLSEDGCMVTMLLGIVDYSPAEIVPRQRGAA